MAVRRREGRRWERQKKVTYGKGEEYEGKKNKGWEIRMTENLEERNKCGKGNR